MAQANKGKVAPKATNVASNATTAPATTAPTTAPATTAPPAWAYPKGKPAQAQATAFTGQFSYNSRAFGAVTGSTLLQRTTKPARSGATANQQSAWVAINAMAPGATATAGNLLGATPTQPYGRNGQAAHLAYAISKGYLVPAK